jgi:hypothetical protein
MTVVAECEIRISWRFKIGVGLNSTIENLKLFYKSLWFKTVDPAWHV